MSVHKGGGRVRGLSTWTKTFLGDLFFAREIKKGHENFKKKVVYVNEFLVSPFEQLYDEFLDKMCARICKKMLSQGGFFENPHGF